jgi:rhodanese-related sulfurtransferase
VIEFRKERATKKGGSMPIRVDRDEVQRLIAAEAAQVVEVLPAAEYEDEHIAGAISIPLKELDGQAARLLDRGRPVIVYCYHYQ